MQSENLFQIGRRTIALENFLSEIFRLDYLRFSIFCLETHDNFFHFT